MTTISANLLTKTLEAVFPAIDSVWHWEPTKERVSCHVLVTNIIDDGEEIFIETDVVEFDSDIGKWYRRNKITTNTLGRWVEATVFEFNNAELVGPVVEKKEKMSKAERAVKACREAADALEEIPFNLRITNCWNNPMLSIGLLRAEADTIEKTAEIWQTAQEEVYSQKIHAL